MNQQTSDQQPQATGQFTNLNEWATRAYELNLHGQYEEAIETARQAQEIVANTGVPETLQAANGLNKLGMTFFETGYKQSALSHYQKALEITERLTPRDDELLASLYNNLGQVEQQLDNSEKAKSYLEQAVTIREQITPDSILLGFAQDNLGTVLADLGDLDKAEKWHLQALDMFERLGGHFDQHVATALGNLSNVFHLRGDNKLAEAYGLRALDIHERRSGLTSPETLLCISSLANIYSKQGDEARVDESLNFLLSISDEHPTAAHRNLADLFLNLANTAFYNFQLDLAERLSTRAVRLLEVLEGDAAADTLQALSVLANVQRATEHIKPAEENYKRALSGYQSLGMYEEAATVMLELGKVYRGGGSYQLAETVIQGAIEEFGNKGAPDEKFMASALGNLALVFYESGNYVRAEQTYAKALDQLPQDAEYGDRPWLLYNQAMLKYHLGQYEESRKLYETAKQLWSLARGVNHPYVATASANIALVYWALGDVKNTITAFAEAEALIDHEMERILAVGSEAKRMAYAGNLKGDLNKVISFSFSVGFKHTGVSKFAAQMLLRRKGRVLDSLAHTLTQVRENLSTEEQVGFNRLQSVRAEISEVIAPLLVHRRSPDDRDKLARLQEEEQRLEADLSYQGALHRASLNKVTLEEVQRELPSDAALLEFVSYSVFEPMRTDEKGPWREMRYAVMLLRSSGDPFWFDIGLASSIDDHLDQWRSALRNPNSADEHRDSLSAPLFEFMVKPLADALDDVTRLIISPDGKLALVPFGQLRDADGISLSERFVVSYVTSGREMIGMTAPKSPASGVIVIAAPNFEASSPAEGLSVPSQFVDRGKFAPLPGTQGEADEIASVFDDVTLYVKNDATSQVLKSVQNPAVLHVATHGIFAPMADDAIVRGLDVLSIGEQVVVVQKASPSQLAHPMYFSGLALAGANRIDNNVITAQEIAGLDLRGTELVVLSACETGLGTIKLGEEFTGLRRALAIAGANTQVTSLWKIPDEATQVLMGHYYRLLLEGYGRAEALQTAQERIAQDPGHPEWKHPFYWAAFVSSGAWGPMEDCLHRRQH